ncbi:MAG: hypothetical protein HY791_35765 [Deltaproteobacteria bacterium]|nr:hypothetical protein [Deltaproteobacteria bacterium]
MSRDELARAEIGRFEAGPGWDQSPAGATAEALAGQVGDELRRRLRIDKAHSGALDQLDLDANRMEWQATAETATSARHRIIIDGLVTWLGVSIEDLELGTEPGKRAVVDAELRVSVRGAAGPVAKTTFSCLAQDVISAGLVSTTVRSCLDECAQTLVDQVWAARFGASPP